MIAGTLGGFVYFNELEEMDALSKGMFFTGALVSILGIVILSARAPPVEFRGVTAGGTTEKYGKVSVGNDDDLDDDVDGSGSGAKRRYHDDSDDDDVDGGSSGGGGVELTNVGGGGRVRANSDVMVRRVSGAFVLTMSDSGSDAGSLGSPRGSLGKSGSFERYTDRRDTLSDVAEEEDGDGEDGRQSVSSRHRSLSESDI